MPDQETNSDDIALWKQYVESYDDYLAAGREFNSKVQDKLQILKFAFSFRETYKIGIHGSSTALALLVAQRLQPHELQALFRELLEVAGGSERYAKVAQDLILSLPHDWLLANIEHYTALRLEHMDYRDYRLTLELYFRIDRDLTRRFAEQALTSQDEDIREAGEDFLERLGTDSN